MQSRNVAFTVGYEGKIVSDLIRDLTAERIKTVIDVRERAVFQLAGRSESNFCDQKNP
jgi:hypothetical protein